MGGRYPQTADTKGYLPPINGNGISWKETHSAPTGCLGLRLKRTIIVANVKVRINTHDWNNDKPNECGLETLDGG